MHIEVWSDLVCPWCFIGKRRLEQAIAESGLADEAHVTHRAYQLNPTATSDGELTVDHLAAKYGLTREEAIGMMDDVAEVAQTVGLHYDLERTINGNTLDAHRLALWAQDTSSPWTLIDAMYSGYFEHGRSLFTHDDLLAFVREAGLDAEHAAGVLAGTAYTQQVLDDQEMASQLGSRGVPFFVIDRKYGISGAQPLELFVSTLQKAASE